MRVWSAVVFIACGGVLVRAATLEPDPSGLGTHRQMGLPACSWVTEGRGPCPTCGMTTAFSLAAHGRLIDSFITQPAAALMALAMAMLVWTSGYALATGTPAAAHARAALTPRVFLVIAALFLAAWLYKRMMG